jgi:hypothetical protein
MLVVRGRTSVAVPFYGVGVFLPIMIMGLAIRQHILQHFTGPARRWAAEAAAFAAALAGSVFVGQIVGKWEEGGWVRLITFTTLFTAAHLVLLSPVGYREPRQINRIVHEKARVQGGMASIVKWQAFKMQEYRFRLMIAVSSLMETLGLQVRRPFAAALASGGSMPAPQSFFMSTQTMSDSTLPHTSVAAAPSTGAASQIASGPSHYHLPPHIVRHRIIVPVNTLNQGTLTALRYAQSLTSDVTAVHVSLDPAETADLQQRWPMWGEGVRLVVLDSPHQMVLEPLLEYIHGLRTLKQDNEILTIVVPQSIQPRWWTNLMRTQMAVLLRLSLPFETGIVITDVPYELEAENAHKHGRR